MYHHYWKFQAKYEERIEFVETGHPGDRDVIPWKSLDKTRMESTVVNG